MTGSADTIVRDHKKRLSECVLWKMQRTYFERFGRLAWANSVPYYLTSNTFIAGAYAEVVARFLQDCARLGRLVGDTPVWVVELGAGHGKFGYHFVSALDETLAALDLSAIDCRYVVTDFVDGTLDACMSHEAWRLSIESGRVDFARFDVERDGALHLRRAGCALAPGPNPTIVIANYVFDSTRQDAFRVEGGRLFEGLATVRSLVEDSGTFENPDLLALDVAFDWQPIEPDYYQDPELNVRLREYLNAGRDGYFLFPVGAFPGLATLSRVAGDNLLVISGDRGHSRLHDVIVPEPPELVLHGSFSFPVNYHAIGRVFAASGGDCLARAHDGVFDVTLLARGHRFAELRETTFAFRQLDRFGPDDFLHMRQLFPPPEASAGQLLAALALSRWDPELFWSVADVLAEVAWLMPADTAKIADAVARVEASRYAMPIESGDAFVVGRVLQRLGRWEEAIARYADSCARNGEVWAAYFNVALCRRALGRAAEADAAFARAVAFADAPKDLREAYAAMGDADAMVWSVRRHGDGDSHFRLWRVLTGLGGDEDAKRRLER